VVFRFRRTFQAKGPDRFVVNLGSDEREVIKAVCEDLDSVLDDGDANPAVRRLFPAAHATDAEVDRQYQDMVHDDLLSSRREILAAVAASSDSRELDRATLEQWMVGLNAVRLVLGTVLDVSEDELPDLQPDDPQLPAWAVYEFLGSVVDAAVHALAATLD
jgi:DNA-binding transcriptional regulator YhcF (GntR family)